MGLLTLLQQNPIIVDVGKQKQATPDISIDFVIGMFAMAGIFLLAALIGSLLVAGTILYLKRRQRQTSPNDPGHTSLQI